MTVGEGGERCFLDTREGDGGGGAQKGSDAATVERETA